MEPIRLARNGGNVIQKKAYIEIGYNMAGAHGSNLWHKKMCNKEF